MLLGVVGVALSGEIILPSLLYLFSDGSLRIEGWGCWRFLSSLPGFGRRRGLGTSIGGHELWFTQSAGSLHGSVSGRRNSTIVSTAASDLIFVTIMRPGPSAHPRPS
jgi:hypothetical protein